MNSTKHIIATFLTLSLVTTTAAAQQPVRLAHADAARLNGRAYTIEMSHAIRIDAHGDVHDGSRTARLRVSFGGARAEGARVRVNAKLDTIRGAVETPHGREVLDARHMFGAAIDLSYARTGGGATYSGNVPALDFATFGGSLPLSALLDYLFQPLPDRAVRAGERWEHTWVRRQVDGGGMTARNVVSRFTVSTLERRGAGTVARVNIETRSSDARAASGDSFESSGFFLIGVEDGLVQEVWVEDVTSGPWDFGGEQLSYKQTSRVHVLGVGVQPTAPR